MKTNKRKPSGKQVYAEPEIVSGAEIIIKANVEYSTRYPSRLGPALHIMGNKEGILWLSNCLTSYANRISEQDSLNDSDPDNQTHISHRPPINQRLSDEIGLSVGCYSNRLRNKILKRCGASKAKKIKGSPIAHLLNHLPFIVSVCQWDKKAKSDVIRELDQLKQEITQLLIQLNTDHR